MLGYSYRRELIDRDLVELNSSMQGILLDLGGKKTNKRGKFEPQKKYIRRWINLNVSPNELPDVVGNGECLPIQTASVDWVICTEVLQFVRKPEDLILEIARVLRVSGHLFITSPFLYRIHDEEFDLQRFTEKKVRELLQAAGFKLVWIKSYGAFFTVIADFLKSALANIELRVIRFLVALFIVPLLIVLRFIDQSSCVKKSEFFTKFTTGYGILAEKQNGS